MSNLLTVHELRRRWQPTKEALVEVGANETLRIRVHRCLSWMSAVEGTSPDAPEDFSLVGLWVAFNSLYGRWDTENREPLPERTSWEVFVSRVLELDADGVIGERLERNRRLVMKVLEHEYLSSYFWEDPGEIRAKKSMKARYDAPSWYNQRQYSMIMSRSLERVYLLRCQLVHGAATHDSRLNREALRLCVMLQQLLLQAMLLVVIDRGGSEDWGALCYPPES